LMISSNEVGPSKVSMGYAKASSAECHVLGSFFQRHRESTIKASSEGNG
jgi:hypothetical protein